VTKLLLGLHEVPLSLKGSLPSEIGNLTELDQFELTDQGLSGALPASLALLTKMVRLDFRHNRLSGSLQPFIGMKQLNFLNLEGDAISGPIPDAVGQLTSLTNLELTGNALNGPIPASLGQLSHLQKLWLDANQLEGSIPAEIGSLGALLELRLGGNNLAGPIPDSIGSLHSLTLLQVGLCHLSGALPSTLADLSSLQELSLGTNRLGGELGNVAWERLGQLQRVFLDNNTLEGAIPPELLRIAGLSDLRLQGNKLRGSVPRDLLTQPNLVGIDLRWNGLQADSDVAARLDSVSSGQFSRTQTLSPVGLFVTGTTSDAACLSWKPATFQDVSGGYQVIYGRAGEPEDTFQTAVVTGKAVVYAVISGLQPGTNYSFQIKTFSDPHAANQSTVTSDASAPILGETAAAGETGQVLFTATPLSAAEGQILHVGVARIGGVNGALRVRPVLTGSGTNPANVGRDISLITQSLQWADQEGGEKDVLLSVAADSAVEPTETAQLQLQASQPGVIGDPGVATLEVLDRTVAGTVDSPVVATTADGLELSVWTVVETRGSKRDVVGRFTAGLTPSVFSLQFMIAGTADVDEYDPVVLPLEHTFVVLWLASDPDGKRRIVGPCEMDIESGRCLRKVKSIVLDASVTAFSAVADGATFWLAWRASSGIHLARFDRQGRVIGRRELVTSDPTAAQPRIARFGERGVFTTWTALVPLNPGDLTTGRPALQGRSFDPATGFKPSLPDLAGPDAVELRDFKLETRPDGAALISWIGVTLGSSPSGPLRVGPNIHLRRVGLSGTLEGSEVVLGCPLCGDLIQSHSIVADPASGDCVATWVSIPGQGVSAPVVLRAKLRKCDASQGEVQLHLVGSAFRVRSVELGSAGGNLLVLGQRTSAPSLDLRSYRCHGGTLCRN